MLENLLFSMNSTMPLFFIMLLGYVLHRTGFLSDAFVAGANKFVFYVALPVQLFRDLGKNDVRATFDGRNFFSLTYNSRLSLLSLLMAGR